MRIIKVSATESTNLLAKEWHQINTCSQPICFTANAQTMGRGQRGASWISNAGENLTMSVLYPNPSIPIQLQFLISASVGLAVLETLKELKINKLALKWPNDIMSANKKTGGILIENLISNGRLAASIIGLGLNVNQLSFSGLPQAGSLRSVTGKEFNLEEVRDKVLRKLEARLDNLNELMTQKILKDYENVLFRKDKVSTFELLDGKFLSGIIKGITSTGLLKVEVEDESIRYFDLKELKLRF